MDFLNDFGVQPILLVAQIVNFGILLFILKKLLYKPILKVLKERKDLIAKNLKDSEELEKKLLQTEDDREKIFEKAASKAMMIINEAKNEAAGIIDDAHQKTSLDIKAMIEKGRRTIENEKESMKQEVREQTAELVAQALKKVVENSLSERMQKEILSSNIKSLK